MHKGPIFQSIEVDSKTTGTRHVPLIKKSLSVRIGTENLIYCGVFVYYHSFIAQLILLAQQGYASIYHSL